MAAEHVESTRVLRSTRSPVESFRQLETGLSRNHGGLGLGLAVAQKLVALLDGSISVDSELGKGSVFIVTLPFKLPLTTSFQE